MVSVVVTGSLDKRHTGETLNSMRFGETVASIAYDVTANTTSADGALAALNAELALLEEVGEGVSVLSLSLCSSPHTTANPQNGAVGEPQGCAPRH